MTYIHDKNFNSEACQLLLTVSNTISGGMSLNQGAFIVTLRQVRLGSDAWNRRPPHLPQNVTIKASSDLPRMFEHLPWLRTKTVESFNLFDFASVCTQKSTQSCTENRGKLQ